MKCQNHLVDLLLFVFTKALQLLHLLERYPQNLTYVVPKDGILGGKKSEKKNTPLSIDVFVNSTCVVLRLRLVLFWTWRTYMSVTICTGLFYCSICVKTLDQTNKPAQVALMRFMQTDVLLFKMMHK